MSKIQWTGETWNPIAGCSKVSPGCLKCYAIKDAHRLAGNPNAKIAEKYAGTTKSENGKINWTGRINFSEDALMIPLKTKKPTTYFVNSMSDLFHENVKDEWIDKIFAVMALSPQHTFQVLTKRADRMREYFSKKVGLETREETIMRAAEFLGGIIWDDRGNNKHLYPPHSGDVSNRRKWGGFPLKNVWKGVSVENQKAADERIPLLLQTPAAVRFLSCEPLLEKLEFSDVTRRADCVAVLGKSALHGIDWVIVGGESVPRYSREGGARPCYLDWIKSIVDQCRAASVPVFVKQLGGTPYRFIDDPTYRDGDAPYYETRDPKGGDINEFPECLKVRELPVKKHV